MAESCEMIARRIADGGPGLSPTSKIRDAIFVAAVHEIRALKGLPPLRPGEAPFEDRVQS